MQKLLFCFFVIGLSVFGAEAQEKVEPAQASRQVRLKVEKPPVAFREALDVGTWKWAKWTNSHLVVHNMRASQTSYAAAAYDPEGNLKIGTTAQIDGAADQSLTDAIMMNNGTLVVSGGMASAKGVIANFIGQTDKDGSLVRILRTNPHVPLKICAIGNRIWSYGWVRQKTEQSHPILYEFDLDSGVQFSALDRYTYIPPNSRFTMSTQVEMSCNDKEVVLFLGPSNKVVRLDARTKAITITDVPAFSNQVRVTGLGVTDSGQVFISVMLSQLGTLFRLTGDSKSGQWLPVDGSLSTVDEETGGVLTLLGTTGNELVCSGRGKLKGHLLWSQVSDMSGDTK